MLIVDESHWALLCEARSIVPADIARPLAVGTETEQAQWQRVAEAIGAAVFEPLILDALRNAKVTAADLTAAGIYLDNALKTLEPVIEKGLPAKEIKRRLAVARAGDYGRVRRLRPLIEALSAEIEIKRKAANGVYLYKDMPIKINTPLGEKPSTGDRVRVCRLVVPHIAVHVPVLLLDASANVDINKRIWGKTLRCPTADIRVERNAIVTQVTSTFSRRAFLGPRDEAVKARREVVDFICRLPAPIAVSYKAAEEEIAFATGACTLHFGKLRGQNVAHGRECIIVIGREEHLKQAEEQARALYATDAEPIMSVDKLVPQTRRYRMRGAAIEVCEVSVPVASRLPSWRLRYRRTPCRPSRPSARITPQSGRPSTSPSRSDRPAACRRWRRCAA